MNSERIIELADQGERKADPAPVERAGHASAEFAPSKVMQTIQQTVDRIAVSDLGILIVGEPGTGKRWLAEMIHLRSGRAGRRFLHVDCSAIAPDAIERELFGGEELTLSGAEVTAGLFETAAGGTIFLDNVADLRPMLQLKIARSLELHHFHRIGGGREIGMNVRVVAAISKLPMGFGSLKGQHPEVYYHRMCPIIINIPPLRERKEDIIFLMEKFLRQAAAGSGRAPRGITSDAVRACLDYDWPGNAWELKKVIEHAAMMCDVQFIARNHLPGYLLEGVKPAGEQTAEKVATT